MFSVSFFPLKVSFYSFYCCIFKFINLFFFTIQPVFNSNSFLISRIVVFFLEVLFDCFYILNFSPYVEYTEHININSFKVLFFFFAAFITGAISGSVLLHSFFSCLWVIFSYFFACLAIFLDTRHCNFTL